MDSPSTAKGVYNTNPFDVQADRGPADFDVRQNWRFNALYHVPNVGSGLLAKLENGWWVGTIVAPDRVAICRLA